MTPRAITFFYACTVGLLLGAATMSTAQPVARSDQSLVFEGDQSLSDNKTTLELPQAGSAQRGTLDITFRLHRVVSVKRECPAARYLELDMPGFSQLRLELTGEPLKSRRELLVLWQDTGQDDDLKMWQTFFFSHFEKDTTYHLAVSWDAQVGSFKCYLNGFLVAADRVLPWKTDTAFSKIAMCGDDTTLLAVRHWATPLSDEQVAEAADVAMPAPVPDEIGQHFEHRPLEVPSDQTLIYENTLAEASDLADWTMEGPGEMTFDNGWMILSSGPAMPQNKSGHFTFWAPIELPDNYLIRWRFRPEHDGGLAMVFLNAEGLGGEDIFDPSLAPRYGNFTEYWRGDLRCYHVSFYDGGEWVRGNKNPYKLMLAVGRRPRYEAGREYELTIMRLGGRLVHAINGEVVFDVEDREDWYGPVWTGGKIALRQMSPCVAAYRDLQVYQLGDDQP